MNEQPISQTTPDPVEMDAAQMDPVPAPDEKQKKERKPRTAGKEPAPAERGNGLPALPSDTARNPETPAEAGHQPDRTLPPDPPAGEPDSEELGQLREELSRLRDEVQSARKALFAREAELEEFHTLWPDVPLAALPDEVLREVDRGVPLAAAYALVERRQQQTAKIAEATNAVNQLRSSGAASGDSSGFLSPAEVRAMSPEQVRKNYRQILLSMPKWH